MGRYSGLRDVRDSLPFHNEPQRAASIDVLRSNTRVPLPDLPRSSYDPEGTYEPRPLSGFEEGFHYRRTSLNLAQEARRGLQVQQPTFEVQPEVVPEKKKISLEKPKKKKGLDAEIQKDLDIDYHIVSVPELIQRYDTNEEEGLTEELAKRKLAENGPNVIQQKSRFHYLWKILRYLFGGFGFVLWPSAILAIISYKPLGEPNPDPSNLGLGIVLFIVIFTNAFFDGWQDWQSAKVMKTIGGMLPSTASVIRGGQRRDDVPVRDLVVGDIVEVKIGEKVPADLRVIQQNQLKVDNSVLTGESEPIPRTVNNTDPNFMESKNMMFMGTSVTEGTGRGVVVATGKNTVMGKITKSTQRGGKMTPINKEILGFITFAVCAALLLSLACLIAWLAWLRVDYPGYLTTSAIIIIILTSVVAFIPEGLPVSVSMTFTLMARRMFFYNVLVKNLPTVETLGSVDIIASDKTGTLTQNKMSVMHVFVSTRVLEFSQFRETYDSDDKAFKEFVNICALCNRAIFDPSTLNLPVLQRKVIGDASDTGILLFAERFVNVQQLRDQHRELCLIPFNSKNKWMLNILASKKSGNNTATLFKKGAAEIILSQCSTILLQDGSEVALTEDIRKEVAATQEKFASEGQRVLGCARQVLDPKQYPSDTYKFDAEEINFPLEGHCFVGLIALIDPPREDVPAAIEKCQRAGIRVMMVTGDHNLTAAAIARMVGIIKHPPEETIDIQDSNTITHDMVDTPEKIKSRAITVRGPVIPTLTKEAWDRILMHHEICWARTTPDHKLKIVKECQARKHVVAVTGDGVNDAPALKQANVGVCMGSGSEVAREAAAIVLIDSKFSSIVAGIENGRVAFENLKKVIIYLLPAGSFSEIIPLIVAVFFGIPQPLSSFLMIVICVCTDIAPSLSLINEKAEADLMERKPRSVTREKLVNPQLLLHAYFFTGIYETVAAMVMYFYYMGVYAGIPGTSLLFAFNQFNDGYYGLSGSELLNHLYTAQSIYFVTLVIVQCGNLFATRTRRLSFFQQPPWKRECRNLYLFVAVIISIVVALLIIHIPFFNNTFNTRPIPVQFWFIPIGWALLYICIDEIRKFFARLIPFRIARYIFW
jgi:sodium/potassium-transporting ATPase subunit alpha